MLTGFIYTHYIHTNSVLKICLGNKVIKKVPLIHKFITSENTELHRCDLVFKLLTDCIFGSKLKDKKNEYGF